jgi:hypothetical protein
MSKHRPLCLVTLGALVLMSSLLGPTAASLDRQGLATYPGGALKFCVGTRVYGTALTAMSDVRPPETIWRGCMSRARIRPRFGMKQPLIVAAIY